ncbi:hypothetical protein PW52_00475 [Tamlana sedimentorum]|uniref:Iron dicitrate transport regulator FecR n=1 Tax=Neotamlana sedimentorum TaxID=1435349 RepID=A0A0D7WD17_9FLAO|nr:FecR family protein [Tamlana sedimentorum]KJD36969.1 hypothetical protein PW52_00475 [Tamlana sedimentorum]
MNDDTFYEIALKNLANAASAKDKALLERYLQDASYVAKYKALQAVQVYNTSSAAYNEFNLKRGLEKLRQKIKEDEKRKFLINKKALAIAASFAILLSVGLWFNKLYISKTAVNYIIASSLKGQRTQITLPDSSTVFLNAGAQLRYPEKFTTNQREVFLTGEAFFKVKRNESKPFMVNSGNFKTTVLGTSFNVNNTNPTSFSVVVKTGKVKVENTKTNNQFILVKNTQVVFNKALNTLEKSSINADYATNWHKNILHFNAITLQEAFGKIETWYNVNIQCNSKTLLNKKIRAVYNDKPLEEVLKSLEFMVGLQYTIENNTVTIK